MLRWRLLLGTLFVAALAGLVVLDRFADTPGAWLMPLALLLSVAATGEVLELVGSVGLRPVRWTIYLGNLALPVANWLPWLAAPPGGVAGQRAAGAWPAAVLLVALGVLLAAEMRRYRHNGAAVAGLCGGGFVLVYVGVTLGVLVQIRMAWGLGALVSLVLVVKLGDVGAYTAGRLFGRRKLAPALSPGKTVEGFVGQVVFCCVAAWVAVKWLAPQLGGAPPAVAAEDWAVVLFGVLMAVSGLLGDLAESLLKREAGQKNSSRWMPGFGGVLDLLDSLLLAAPAAWLFWAALGGGSV